ncbi:hypothetical protein ACQEU3_39795 [Spirillospora sp. CA-253888]
MEQVPLLPLHLEGSFQVWSYRASHRTLILRTHPGGGYDHYLDVVFVDVLGMKLASSYQGLRVAVADDPSPMDDFLQMPDRYRHRYLNLQVSDGARGGFVVCGRVRLREGLTRMGATRHAIDDHGRGK